MCMRLKNRARESIPRTDSSNSEILKVGTPTIRESILGIDSPMIHGVMRQPRIEESIPGIDSQGQNRFSTPIPQIKWLPESSQF